MRYYVYDIKEQGYFEVEEKFYLQNKDLNWENEKDYEGIDCLICLTPVLVKR